MSEVGKVELETVEINPDNTQFANSDANIDTRQHC
jgi:hypothetical protein